MRPTTPAARHRSSTLPQAQASLRAQFHLAVRWPEYRQFGRCKLQLDQARTSPDVESRKRHQQSKAKLDNKENNERSKSQGSTSPVTRSENAQIHQPNANPVIQATEGRDPVILGPACSGFLGDSRGLITVRLFVCSAEEIQRFHGSWLRRKHHDYGKYEQQRRRDCD